MRSLRNSWATCWHLPVILVVAFFLRLAYLEWAGAYALGSQVNDSVEAYEVAVNYLANDERAHYIGQPNCNLHSKLPGPAWALFCVAGLKLGGGMHGIVLATILVNILALALTWYLTRNLFDPASATFAALWMAVSPWTVFYSSIIFNPSLMPLFGVLIFLALFRCLAKEKSRAVFFLPLLVLLGLQVHLSLLTLIPPLVALAWLRQMRPAWSWLCAGVIAGLLCYLPYVAGESRHHWANTHGMLTGSAGGYSATALRVFSSPFSFFINYWAPSSTYTPDEYRALAQQTFGGPAGLVLTNAI
ncbi:MAG TPA: glycosyltransferase family 39 protein, partial [Chthoniobacter sp.]|nr:glycosyltransferase family 39 protein [Chthoniobacter sp.]